MDKITPLNGHLQVEEVEEETVFKVNKDNFSPQPMRVIALSAAWEEDGNVRTINSIIKIGSIVLPARVFVHRIKTEEVLFAKESDLVAVL